MPIFPIVSTVSYPKLTRYSRFAHGLKELDISVKQEIVISTILIDPFYIHGPADMSNVRTLSLRLSLISVPESYLHLHSSHA